MAARVKVLLLAANTNPAALLKLDEEYKQIRRFLDVTPEWDALEIVYEPQAEAAQLPQRLMREKPDIIHFSGHADKQGRVQMVGPNMGVSRIEPDALYRLLSAVRADVKLVFFNTCYSDPAAKKVIELVPFCIGTKGEIDDPVAIQFSALLYQGLGFGMTVAEAYRYAEAGVAVALGSIPHDEHPQIRQNANADPNKIRLRSPRTEELKRRYQRGAILAGFATLVCSGIAAWLSFPAFGWLSPGLAKVQDESMEAKDTAIDALTKNQDHYLEEIAVLGGDISPPKEYPPPILTLDVKSSRQEITANPERLGHENRREKLRGSMDAWQWDFLSHPRGPKESFLIARSPKEFSPPFKSCQYAVRINSGYQMRTIAAFLVRDNGDDTRYRPVYRQMEVTLSDDKHEGALLLDRPRNNESLLIYVWVARAPGNKDTDSLSERPGSDFGLKLTDLVTQP